jgi:hypothetical protein
LPEIVLAWIVFSVIAGVIAGAKGRSGVGYFALSMVLSPLVGVILAAALPRLEPATDGRPCPYCAEPIRRAAVICRHCGRDVPAPAPTKPDPMLMAPAEHRLRAALPLAAVLVIFTLLLLWLNR